MNALRRALRDERGEVEEVPAVAIVLVGVILPLIGVIMFMGRYGTADNTVASAAAAAARDASLSRTAVEAVPHAKAAAVRALEGNVSCASLDLSIGGTGSARGWGRPGR
ncbi:hypothetical protein [Clavibacter sepedonicus]|uniref:hypothetical protein n=1 Tax=Clavibacter sepedonicus TaxID=31964 RepID=UPI001FF0AC0C|nr:hypothetical protein [Clavibacter sepedonicus]